MNIGKCSFKGLSVFDREEYVVLSFVWNETFGRACITNKIFFIKPFRKYL